MSTTQVRRPLAEDCGYTGKSDSTSNAVEDPRPFAASTITFTPDTFTLAAAGQICLV